MSDVYSDSGLVSSEQILSDKRRKYLLVGAKIIAKCVYLQIVERGYQTYFSLEEILTQIMQNYLKKL